MEVWKTFLLLFVALATARARYIASITYSYTTCGNENGKKLPTVTKCSDFYENEQADSLIFQDNQVGGFDENNFTGAQRFQVRKTGMYDITVAGAAGGRGLCSTEFGRGAVMKIRVQLEAGQEALILVGQKGLQPCDVNSQQLCQNPPMNKNQRNMCGNNWNNFSDGSDLVYNSQGGAAGGGASMVWLRQSNGFAEQPLVVGGGGGGTPSVFPDPSTFDLVRSLLESDNKTDTNIAFYQDYVNGKDFPFDEDTEGILGTTGRVFVIGGTPERPGVGGGWNNGGGMRLGFDGNALSSSMEFADGGRQCPRPNGSAIVFDKVNGGFGGGGGGCSGGGGGGGYTGGAAVRDTPLGCGEGGFSFVANSSSGKEADFCTNNDTGFVEIIPVDCGCTGSCVVYESDQFECVCPENSVLAPDQSDCYKNDASLNFSMSSSLQVENLLTSGLIFTEKLFLYSIGARLSSVNEEATCAIILIGYVDEETESESFVLVSDPVKTSGKTSSLAVFNKTGRGEIGDYEEFLQERVLVTGAVVLSTSPCDVGGISAKISIQKLQEDPIALVKIQSLVNDANILKFAPEILHLASSTANGVLTISLSVAGSVLFLILLLLLCSIVIVCIFKNRIKKAAPITENGQKNNTPSLEVTEEHKYEVIDLGDEVGNSAYNKSVPLHLRYEMMQYTDNDNPERAAPEFPTKFGLVTPSIDFSPYNKARIDHSLEDWTYPRDKLIYMRELGEGQFGKVLLMKAADGIAGYEQPLPVAVKTITSTDPEVVKNFGQEAELMKKFCHPNIVSLLGYTAGYKENQISTPLMIIEYMCYGDLEGFLKSNRPQEGKTSQVTLTHCYRFAIDVAKALDFLSSMHYIHRDIASRNCLVGSDLKVKIADFGMARGVHSKDYYKIAGSAVLPVRWMAPENLLLGVFTTASDVWSFGVLLLEIITFAALPLEGIASQEIIEMAQKSTLQHKRPADCPDEWFQILKSCHMISPQERPKPSEVLDALQEAMKMLLVVAEFEPELPQQHVGFPDTTESLTHEISLEQSGDIDLHALVPVRVSLQPEGFPSGFTNT